MQKKILGIIGLRAGSKGLKNKNIKLLGGIPLFAHILKSAKKSKHSIVSKTRRKDDTLVFDSSTFLLSFASDESVIYCSVYTEKNDDIDKSSNFSPLALLMKSSSEA